MFQSKFLGGCLTRRPEILVTLQSPAEIVGCHFHVMIYFSRRINFVCLSVVFSKIQNQEMKLYSFFIRNGKFWNEALCF